MINNPYAYYSEIVRSLSEEKLLVYSDIGKIVSPFPHGCEDARHGIGEGWYHQGLQSVNPFASAAMAQFVVNIETTSEHFEVTKAWFAEAEQTLPGIASLNANAVLEALKGEASSPNRFRGACMNKRDMNIDELQLSVRSMNALKRQHIILEPGFPRLTENEKLRFFYDLITLNPEVTDKLMSA